MCTACGIMSEVSAAIKRVEREFKNAEFICAIVFVDRVRFESNAYAFVQWIKVFRRLP